MVVVWERFYGVEIKWWCYGSVFEVWRLVDGVKNFVASPINCYTKYNTVCDASLKQATMLFFFFNFVSNSKFSTVLRLVHR